ncbi:MAG: hypothetical protein HY928_04415 [Elusimicrobia bacterium]|nr:hypothetical protein [Elusimicrobiota bacterium]
MDHADPALGSFRGFYILSPGFRSGPAVVFFFTDGQMELVDASPDTAFFDEQLPGLPYVLIGHRGHSPTLFPEVYDHGRVNLRRAAGLYGSWQRVEDIERVRLDMLGKGLLPADGRIMVYGASGAGVLAQQYLHRYGRHVSRALLSVTGAPDIAARLGVGYARSFSELDPESARILDRLVAANAAEPDGLAYLLFKLGRAGLEGLALQRRVIGSLAKGNRALYRRLRLKPNLSLPLARFLLSSPLAEAAKVRMFELLGPDLRRRAGDPRAEFSLLYQWAPGILADYLSSDIQPADIRVERRKFDGEVLVVSALQDVVFSPAVGLRISKEYRNAGFQGVRGGHRLTDDGGAHAAVRKAFFLHGLRSPELKLLLDASRAEP